MTDIEKRVVIADACGWRAITVSKQYEGLISGDPPPPYGGTTPVNHVVPDYLNDLNAMHEAEKVLTDDQYDRYCYQLKLLVGPFREIDGISWAQVHATAAQRAEAFLRTLNLYNP